MDKGADIALTSATYSLWAKSDYGEGACWLPLFVHSCDAAAMGARLWDEWLPWGTKKTIARPLGNDEGLARCLTIFLCAVHDIGKATPAFQAKGFVHGGEAGDGLAWIPRRAGLNISAGIGAARPTHPIAGEMLLCGYLEHAGVSRRLARAISSIVGAHHGNPPRDIDLANEASYAARLGRGRGEESLWECVQLDLIRLAFKVSDCNRYKFTALDDCALSAPFASLITGIVVMADWLASNEFLFPLIEPVGGNGGYLRGNVIALDLLQRRADRAWKRAGIIPTWSEKADHIVSSASFETRFELPEGAQIRPVQRCAIETAQMMSDGGMIIIEAPMGEGKTEAALAAAEILAQRAGSGGVCVALPTMATTDAMFGRIHKWLNSLPRDRQDRESTFLAHGKARLNEEYQGLVRQGKGISLSEMGVDVDPESGGGAERGIVTSWMQGSKKGMLANFVVCTVDQVLMGALQMRHLSLRQLALANKVVIIDECHAYDAYMQMYLCRILEWLGAMRAPVILLSATLPARIRESLSHAYRDGISADVNGECGGSLLSMLPQRGSRCKESANPKALSAQGDFSEKSCLYPAITAVTGGGVQTFSVERSSRGAEIGLFLIEDNVIKLVAMLDELLSDGGCAGVICNTVSRAQAVVDVLAGSFGENEVLLTHARFMDIDRIDNENRLRSLLGKDATMENGQRPGRLIVVGTQVLEQSLDIDFDLLVTDIAPIDLIFQRLGRVHRHDRGRKQENRPVKLRSANCLIRGVERVGEGPEFEAGVRTVYEPASLMEALGVLKLHVLGDHSSVSLPSDIASMVQSAYGCEAGKLIPDTWLSAYELAREKREAHLEDKRRRAEAYLVASAKRLIWGNKTLIGLLSRNADADALHCHDDDYGPRAVRDTQETVEVLLVERHDKALYLMPWVGAPEIGIEMGEEIPIECEPSEDVASLMCQCSVRLPLAMSRPQGVDALIEELEKLCGQFVGAWQDSGWLAGKLILPVVRKGELFTCEVGDWWVSYTRGTGLSAARR